MYSHVREWCTLYIRCADHRCFYGAIIWLKLILCIFFSLSAGFFVVVVVVVWFTQLTLSKTYIYIITYSVIIYLPISAHTALFQSACLPVLICSFSAVSLHSTPIFINRESERARNGNKMNKYAPGMKKYNSITRFIYMNEM